MRLLAPPSFRLTALLVGALLSFVFYSPSGFAAKADKIYQLDYTIALQPRKDSARVTIRISDGALLKSVDFSIDPERHSNIKADGKVRIKNDRAIWKPSKGPAKFDFTAKISSKRDDGTYNARITEDWAIFRGDNIIPTATVKAVKGATSDARLSFRLPRGWNNVDTGWPRMKNGSFAINNPQRNFDRPVGWMIAGKVPTRKETFRETEIAVGAPSGSTQRRVGSALRRAEIMALFSFVWPEVERIFQKLPPKLLVVGAGDPMWRGGLSAPNSFYVHADILLLSEGGTSTLLHELTHAITRIRGYQNADWIAEGMAEYYSIELVHRSGGMTDARYKKIRKGLKNESKNVKTLRVKHSSGSTTARAVILLQDLDKEIREQTNNRQSLDNVTRELMQAGKVSLRDLRASAEALVGGKLKALDSALLK